MRYLKQNTDSYITVGPALDKTAGFGNEDGLTVTSFSGVLVKEVQSNACIHTDFTPSATGANDWGMVAIGHGGAYQFKIPDSEINFVGSASLYIWYDAEALPMWCEFMIVPANVWDSLMGTDALDVSIIQIGGVVQSLTDLKDFADTGYDPATHKVAGVVLIDTCTINTDMRGTNSAALASVCTEGRLAELDAANLITDVANVLTQATEANAHAHTIDGNVTAARMGALTDLIDGGRLDLLIDAIKASTDLVTAILADTNELQTDLHDGGRLDFLIDSIDTAITSLNDLSAAQVNAEVVDALNVDTYAEPGQEAPAAAAPLSKKIGYLYKMWRNRKTQTATVKNLYNDDGTTIGQKATVSDDITTLEHGKMGTGA